MINPIYYHSMTFPDGETVDGAWDIRGRFREYIGGIDLRGKTVLDVGTASGFLAFESERAGATSVLALDALDASEFDRIPFTGNLSYEDRDAHDVMMRKWFARLQIGFNLSKERFASNVEYLNMPLRELLRWDRQFDVVLAGAILEHLADPITAIGGFARVARETVSICFTPVIDSDTQIMETVNDWSNQAHDYTFWTLSRGLYKRVFDNLGFDVRFTMSSAITGGALIHRPTIIATRRGSKTFIEP